MKLSEKLVPIFTPYRFAQFAHWGFLGYCAVASLSIALSQFILVIVNGYWVFLRLFQFFRAEIGEIQQRSPEQNTNDRSNYLTQLSVPLISYMIISYIAAFAGIHPEKAVPEILKATIYVLLPFSLSYSLTCTGAKQAEIISRIRKYLAALLFGQCVASVHTILSGASGRELWPHLPGPVTESGQLVLVIAATVGFLLLTPNEETVASFSFQSRYPSTFNIPSFPKTYAGIVFSLFLLFVWPEVIQGVVPILSPTLVRFVALFVALLILFSPFFRKDSVPNSPFASLLWTICALLFSALLINLKRGPWLGVCVELFVIGIFCCRKLALITVIIPIVLLIAFSPIRTRLFHYAQDFTIEGGRQRMWALGLEIVQRFPLGLGQRNASFMRELDPTLPEQHRHMHNNLLNVTVETGWIGLMCYLWWMFVAIRMGFVCWEKVRQNRLIYPQGSSPEISSAVGTISLCLACALLGWQVAGAVEYNFGDGEVRLIALFFMGLLVALAEIGIPAAHSCAPDSSPSPPNPYFFKR